MYKKITFWMYIVLIAMSAYLVVESSLIRVNAEMAVEEGNNNIACLASTEINSYEYMNGDVEYNIGYFEEIDRSYKTLFRGTRMYIVPVVFSDGTVKYIGLRVDSSEYEKMDKMTGNSVVYAKQGTELATTNKDILNVTGKVKKYSKAESTLLLSYLSDKHGYGTMDECAEYVVSYYIDYAEFAPAKKIMIVASIFGLFMILFLSKYINRYKFATREYKSRIASKYKNQEIYNDNYRTNNGDIISKKANDFENGYMDVFSEDIKKNTGRSIQNDTYGNDKVYGSNKAYGSDKAYGSNTGYESDKAYGSNTYEGGKGGNYGLGNNPGGSSYNSGANVYEGVNDRKR